MKLRFWIASIVLGVFGLWVSSFAQYRGTLQGTVTDSQGAVVGGAKVTLTDRDTNRELSMETDAAGFYSFNGLAPSHYTLVVEKSGFKKQVFEDVGINPEQVNGLNVTLALGQLSETVTVNGDATPLLDTETATLGATITTQQVQALPSFGRDVFQLLQLAPGAFGDAAQAAGGGASSLPGNNGPGGSGNNTGIFAIENGAQISVGGGRREVNNFQIDGVGVTSVSWGGTSVITPNEEAVKEVQVVTSAFDAEDGRFSGGQVKVLTRSGTNQYHGSAFWRMARAGLNAYQKYNGVGNSPTRNEANFNDFGGSVGGPIIKNKLFAFFAYETIRSGGYSTTQGWFETSQYLASAPAGSVAAKYFAYPGVGVVPGTVLEGANDSHTCADVGLIDGVNCHFILGQGLDVGRPLLFPVGTADPSWANASSPGLGGDGSGSAANLDGIPDLQFVSSKRPHSTVQQQYFGRADYNLTSKDLLAFTIFYVPNRNQDLNGSFRPMNAFTSEFVNRAATFLWDRTITPTLQNEFRANAAGWRWFSLQDNPNAPFGLPLLQVQNLAGGGIGSVVPNGFGVGSPSEFNQWTYAAKDVVSKVYRSHTMKMGAEMTRLLFVDAAPWNARPTYYFNNMWDQLNDAPVQEGATFNPITGVPSDFRKDTRSTLYGLFFQDDYKVKPNLTLNLGLRWEYFGPISEKNGNLGVVVLGQGVNAIQDISVRKGGNLYNAQKANFGPQVGFAWSPSRFAQRLVVRGGFGIGYTGLQEANSLDGRNNPPFLSPAFNLQGNHIVYGLNSLPSDVHSFYGYASNPSAIANFDPQTNLPIPGPNYSPVTLQAYEKNWPSTRTYRYTLDTQYDLGHQWVATLGYQGTASRHLTRLYNYFLYEYSKLAAINQGLLAFNPAVSTVNMYDNEGYGNFNAMLAGLRHRFSHSLELEAQYRWAKGLDTGSNNYAPAQFNGSCSCGGGAYQFFPLNQEYALCWVCLGCVFKLFGVWSPKLFHGDHSTMEKIFGGWSLSGIVNWHSGFPWNPVLSSYASNPNDPNSAVSAANAIYVGSMSTYGGGAPLRPFNYAGGLNVGNFKDQKYPNGVASLFPSPAGCLVQGPALSDILSGAALPGPIPCKPGIGRNSFRGPGYFDVDASFSKDFGLPSMRVLGENAKFQLRANFYNLFNNVNLTNISNDIGNPASPNIHFGQALGALGSRTIDFQLKFSF